MAHTPRKKDEVRPHPALYPLNSTVGMYVLDKSGQTQLATGRINYHDEGGWIYVDWDKRYGANLPGYLRSTHVVLVDQTTATATAA